MMGRMNSRNGQSVLTTFLHAHSLLNWVYEDAWWGWGWLEIKARRHSTCIYIKIIQWECEQRNQLCHYWELQTQKRAGSSLPGGSWEGVKSISRRTNYYGTVGCRRPQSKESCVVWGLSIITHIIHWCPFTSVQKQGILFGQSEWKGKHFLVEVILLCKKAPNFNRGIFRHLTASAATARSPPPSPQELFLHSISNNTIMVPLNNDKNSPKLGILVPVNRRANWKAIIINCNS